MSWQAQNDIATRVMKGFTFTQPVEVSDLEYVEAALQQVLHGCTVSVKAVHPRFVSVQVYDEQGLIVYGQEHVVR